MMLLLLEFGLRVASVKMLLLLLLLLLLEFGLRASASLLLGLLPDNSMEGVGHDAALAVAA